METFEELMDVIADYKEYQRKKEEIAYLKEAYEKLLAQARLIVEREYDRTSYFISNVEVYFDQYERVFYGTVYYGEEDEYGYYDEDVEEEKYSFPLSYLYGDTYLNILKKRKKEEKKKQDELWKRMEEYKMQEALRKEKEEKAEYERLKKKYGG